MVKYVMEVHHGTQVETEYINVCHQGIQWKVCHEDMSWRYVMVVLYLFETKNYVSYILNKNVNIKYNT
jgi:hypothetical protein